MPAPSRHRHVAGGPAGGIPGSGRPLPPACGHLSELLEQRPRLAADLLALRQAAGLSTTELARRLGWSQAKVSRLERGRNAAQPEDVVAWARATGASPDQVARLRERAEQALVEVAVYRGRTLPDLARGVASLERVTGLVRDFNGVAITGLLQTEAYARAMFATGERDAAAVAAGVAARLERAGVLLEAGHRFEFVIGESALRWRFGPVEAMAEQVERLRVVASLPNVELGILPTDIEGPVWHWLPFTLFDERLDDGDPVVLVETLSTSLRESDPAAVGQYRRVFERVRQAARYGEEGFSLLAPGG